MTVQILELEFSSLIFGNIAEPELIGSLSCEVTLDPATVSDKLSQPRARRLKSEGQNPARHRDEYPFGGDLIRKRVEPFPSLLR